MKPVLFLAFTAAGLLLAPAPALAQKEKKPGLPPGNLFFSLKGKPSALEHLCPGVQGALLLTDGQNSQIGKALEETIGSEAVRSAGKTVKQDPGATEAQKEQARKVIQEARAKVEQQIAGVLTQEQRTLINRLNAAAAEAHQTARTNLESEFLAAKGNKERMEEVNKKMREEARAEFDRKLVGLLTAEQRQGLEAAARRQKEGEEAGAKKRK